MAGRSSYYAYRAGAEVARLVPAPIGAPLARGISQLVGLGLMGARTRQVQRNLARVHGTSGASSARTREVASTFESYGRYFYELFRLPGASPEFLRQRVDEHGFDHIRAALEAGNGVVLALPHLGNWDFAGAWLAGAQGVTTTVVAEPLEPPELFDWFVRTRAALGMRVIPLSSSAGSEVLHSLRANEAVCLLCDRDLTGDGVDVEFFGEHTTMPGGPALMALRSGAPLIPVGCYFLPHGRHHLEIGPPIDTARQGGIRADVERITQDLAHRFEALIRTAPEDWHLMGGGGRGGGGEGGGEGGGGGRGGGGEGGRERGEEGEGGGRGGVSGQIEEARRQEHADEKARVDAEIDSFRTGLANGTLYTASGDGARQDDLGNPYFNRGGDPWGQVAERSSPIELRDRAMFAAERSEHITGDMAEIIETLADDKNDVHGVGARWAVATSRPSYRAAFETFLRHPGEVSLMLDNEQRAAYAQVQEVRSAWAEGTTTTGGFAVPADYDLNLMLQNSGTVNPFRDISKVVQTSSNVWKGLNTAGVTAEWHTESTEATDATPAVGQPSINVYAADAYLQASFEVVQDSNLAGDVMMLIADARDRLESTVFAVGTGGGQPWGVVTRVSGVTASRVAGTSGSGGAADFVIGDVYAVDNALPSRYYPNASWVSHRVVRNKIRRFGEGATGSNSAFWTDLGSGAPPNLIGHPIYESDQMDSTIVSGSNDDVLLLGDFRQGYCIVDRIGTFLTYNPLVIGSNRRPTGEVGFYGFWRTGADVLDSTCDQFRLLRL